MRLARTWLVGAGACSVLAFTSCAVATPSAGAVASTVARPIDKGTNPPLVTDPFDYPAADHVIVYDADLVSGPLPGPPPTSAITETAARAAAHDGGPTVGPDARPTANSATLRMIASDTDSLTPGRPAWIVIWSHTYPMFSRPVGEHWDAATSDCETVVVIDAISAIASGGVSQYCRANVK